MNTIPRQGPAAGVLALVAVLAQGASAAAQGPAGIAPNPATASASAGAATAAPDIRDIRGPKAVVSPWLIPMTGLTVLIAAGASYGAWAWNRRRLRETLRLPHEIALARLDAARELLAPGHAREFSMAMSDIVREYIERRFDIRAAHLTTDEFLRTLTTSSNALLAANRALLDEFLKACDLAKFGGWSLSGPEMETLLQGARRFVVESQPAAAKPGPAPTPTPTPVFAAEENHASLPST